MVMTIGQDQFRDTPISQLNSIKKEKNGKDKERCEGMNDIFGSVYCSIVFMLIILFVHDLLFPKLYHVCI